VVLLIIGSLTQTGPPTNPFLHKMPQVLWVLAVLSHWTVVHRVYHTWREMRGADRAAVEAAQLKREEARKDDLVRADYSVQN
jgi:CDP-diacylglycerol--glycerol-3-phosphate 3-phosphatidyltransferase